MGGGGGRRGLTLISMLIALVIIAILAVLVLSTVTGNSRGRGGEGGAAPIQKARGVQCPENLKFIRAMLLDYETLGEPFPAQLRDGGPGSVTRCSQTDRPYSYDPRTGRVWCTTPGHEGF